MTWKRLLRKSGLERQDSTAPAPIISSISTLRATSLDLATAAARATQRLLRLSSWSEEYLEKEFEDD